MEKDKLIGLALVEWTVNFKSGSKKTKDARANFEELFQKWKDLNCTFDDLYETWLPKAIKIHQPLPAVARSVYKKFSKSIDKTEKEFVEEWRDTIETAGTDAFFEFFPATPLDHDPEPKIYGKMSAAEYSAQRRYADRFPTLNTQALIEQWETKREYNLDVDDALKNVLGIDDEVDS